MEALRGINLSLRGGELTLLMGPSGSGKTTLLSVLGCILSPTRGTIRILGHPTTGAGPEELAELRRQHVGFVSACADRCARSADVHRRTSDPCCLRERSAPSFDPRGIARRQRGEVEHDIGAG